MLYALFGHFNDGTRVLCGNNRGTKDKPKFFVRFEKDDYVYELAVFEIEIPSGRIFHNIGLAPRDISKFTSFTLSVIEELIRFSEEINSVHNERGIISD